MGVDEEHRRLRRLQRLAEVFVSVRVVDEVADAVLADLVDGIKARARSSVGRRAIQPGDSILLYTDGLIERRGVDLAESLEGLVSLATDRPELVHDVALLAKHLDSGSHADDTCILSVAFAS